MADDEEPPDWIRRQHRVVGGNAKDRCTAARCSCANAWTGGFALKFGNSFKHAKGAFDTKTPDE